MGYWSPEARKAYRERNKERLAAEQKARYRADPEKWKGINRKSKIRLDNVVYAAKSRPCSDCKQTFPSCVMQFDHVRGEKTVDVAVLRNRGNLTKILEEMDKCEVVCANCHAIRTCLRDTRDKQRQCAH